MKQQVNDISEVLRGLSAQIESMQKTIDSQLATICQINRTSQGQLKEIRNLKNMLKKKDKVLEESESKNFHILHAQKSRIFSDFCPSYVCIYYWALEFYTTFRHYLGTKTIFKILVPG